MAVLVTGASRGLGLEFVRQLAALKNISHVIATCRDPEQAKRLQDVASRNSKVIIRKLDVGDEGSFHAVVGDVAKIVGNAGLNVLINNAAINLGSQNLDDGLDDVNTKDMLETYRINAVAPLLLTKAFLPLLKQAVSSNPADGMSIRRAAIVNISSSVASLSESTVPDAWYTYKLSKAALNSATATLAQDLKKEGILVVAISPGHVRTDMGGTDARMEPPECISGIIEVLKKLNEQDTGKFYRYDGYNIPW